ncbi:feruloyl esterase B [Whalleya microplaca]|nr:feruloyl esterase B [Whalleya microplaca]
MLLINVLLFTGLAVSAVVKNELGKRQGTACASLIAPEIPGASVVSITGTQVAAAPARCVVTLVLNHTNSTDRVNIITWLPARRWNGRFLGTGGSGFTAGGSPTALLTPVAEGYAAGTTDAGLPISFDGTAFANDTQLVTNFAHLSIHEMTVVGKALSEQFYGTPVKYAYWSGCSTGGRQGYMEAQRYPEDYQGVYAASPAINWDRFHVAMLWPYIVQNVEGEFVPQCIFDTLTNAAIEACDADDSGVDKLISNPNACKFDATSMVGKSATCGEDSATNITERQAFIFNKIAHGPVDAAGNKLWSGIALGASHSSLAGSQPFALGSGWTRAYVLRDLDYDLKQITYNTFTEIINKAHTEWDELIGTDNPDLSGFQQAGGKLLSWHGWADPLIFANGTVDYRLRVEQQMGGSEEVDEFYRLFFAPGVGHCGGGGPVPTEPFKALVNWVEKGEIPQTLAATGGGNTRNLCRFPYTLKYRGSGAIAEAASWSCL